MKVLPRNQAQEFGAGGIVWWECSFLAQRTRAMATTAWLKTSVGVTVLSNIAITLATASICDLDLVLLSVLVH